MDKSILLQKQVRDNSEDLRSYLKELATWEDDMKRKESELTNNNDLPEVPIPRTKIKKIETKKEIKKETPKKIKSYDYAAWDKFDVDAECEKIDAEKKDSESDNEEPSEEYKNSLRDEAIFEKEKGNEFVKNKKWDEAIACYTHSIACYSKDPIFYANRALCFLKKNDLRSTDADCTSALQLDSTYVKALQRRAVAREGLKQYQESLDDLTRVLELEPHNKESRNELDRLERRLGISKQKPVETKIEEIIKPVDTMTEKIIEPTLDAIPVNVDNKSITKQETLSVKQSTLIPEKQPKIKAVPKQIPWPDRPNAEIILPVTKLPHQRSKKPLRRIEIIESDDNDVVICKKTETQTCEFNNLNLDYDENNTLAKILAQSSQLDVDEILKDIENNVNDEINNKTINTENKSRSNLTISSPPKSNIESVETKPIGDSNVTFNFPIPKSSVQFYSNWKIMKNHQEQKFLYLSKMKPSELPKIFQESLESDVFSDIIIILSKNFIEENLPTFSYLESLSNVKRFSALTLFMSSKDKICLKKIFDYCEKKNESSKEEIDKLRKKYEI